MDSAELLKFYLSYFKNNRYDFKGITKFNFIGENGQSTGQLTCTYCECSLTAVRQLCL